MNIHPLYVLLLVMSACGSGSHKMEQEPIVSTPADSLGRIESTLDSSSFAYFVQLHHQQLKIPRPLIEKYMPGADKYLDYVGVSGSEDASGNYWLKHRYYAYNSEDAYEFEEVKEELRVYTSGGNLLESLTLMLLKREGDQSEISDYPWEGFLTQEVAEGKYVRMTGDFVEDTAGLGGYVPSVSPVAEVVVDTVRWIANTQQFSVPQ